MEKIDEITNNQQLTVAPQQITQGCPLDSDQIVIWQLLVFEETGL